MKIKLNDSDIDYKSFFDNMVDGLAYCQMVFDAQGNGIDFIYKKVNKNFEELTGLQNVTGKKASELVPGINVSNPELIRMYSRVVLEGGAERFETYIKGLSKWFLVSMYSPKKNFFIVVFQNITGQKQTEKDFEDAKIAARNVLEDLSIEKKALEIASAKEKAILFSIGDGFLVTDDKENITFINRTAEKMLDIKSKEVVGKFYSDVLVMEDEEALSISMEKRPLHIALKTGTPTITTTFAGPVYHYVRRDKTKFPVAIIVTPIIIQGKVTGAIEVFRDITLEKEIDRAKSEFVSLASHQLRTPLTTISWYTEMILNGDLGEVAPNQKKYLEEIYRGNKRMIELVNTLLNVSRIELGTLMFKPDPTDIVELARSVLSEQKLEIRNKNLKVVENFSSDVPTISIDSKLLRLVFQNLISNSVEYTLPGGKIEFSISFNKSPPHKDTSEQSKKNILIKISDTGYGIPNHQQDQIFKKFFRADNVRERDTTGTGLGLYITKSIIEKSGGKIWFESPTVTSQGGKETPGTTFYITFPLDGVKKRENTK